MALENKLGLTSSAELAREEERISKKKAVELFESGMLDKLEAGKFSSLKAMQECWDRMDNGIYDTQWDCDWCDLNSDINVAEVEQEISSEQAWYLREKYLRMERY